MKKIELGPEERRFLWVIETLATFCLVGVFYFGFWKPTAPLSGICGILFGFCQGAGMGIAVLTEKEK